MILSLIQSNCSAINSVYIYHDFLHDKSYLDLLKNKLQQHLEVAELSHQTNVKAKMTKWEKLLEDPDFGFLHTQIINTIYNTLSLRNPCTNERFNFQYTNSWGMCHEEGDETLDHIHDFRVWSGAFYIDVPYETKMWFEDFQDYAKILTNTLVFFQGGTKHRVEKHIGKEKRYSMAFNVLIQNTGLD